MRGAAVAAALAVGLVILAGPPAAAHLAIRLDIVAPRPGARVHPTLDAIVFAQRTLAGVDAVTFVPLVDGAPISSGIEISADAEVRVPLRALAPGSHTFAVRYRPDVDEPVATTSVAFVVDRPNQHHAAAIVAAAVAVAVLVVTAVGLIVIRR